MIKESIQKYLTVYQIVVSLIKVLQDKAKSVKPKGKMGKSTIFARSFSTSCLIINKPSKLNMSQDIEEMNNISNQLYQNDIYRAFY